MEVEILVVGNEILIGKTLDTNSNWIAKRLVKYGHELKRITTIEDNIDVISKTLQKILERKPDMVITTGGLGPTFDDMTLAGIAKGLNRELELNQHAYNSIKRAYENAHKQGILKLEGMTKEREKMSYLPEGSIPLPNVRGTAPGVKLNEGQIDIFILPGVPSEMKAIFLNVIKPILKEKRGKFVEKGLFFMGIGESQIAPYTAKLEEKYPQLWIKTHPKIGLSFEVEISITGFNVENGDKLAERALDEIREIILSLNGRIRERK
jgi:molybdenum cofactor synthesis domain-containing protein